MTAGAPNQRTRWSPKSATMTVLPHWSIPRVSAIWAEAAGPPSPQVGLVEVSHAVPAGSPAALVIVPPMPLTRRTRLSLLSLM